MANQNTITQYQLVLNGKVSSGVISFYDNMDGWTDEDAEGLYAALENWIPPQGTTFQVLRVTTNTTSQAAGGNPVAFS